MKRLTFLLSSFAAVTLSPAVAEEPAARPYWRTIVRGTHGMAAAEHPLEAMAGFDALKTGGNAIHPAVAVYYMPRGVEPHPSRLRSDRLVPAYIAKERQ